MSKNLASVIDPEKERSSMVITIAGYSLKHWVYAYSADIQAGQRKSQNGQEKNWRRKVKRANKCVQVKTKMGKFSFSVLREFRNTQRDRY